MSITTKTGDDGKSRFLGKVIDKDSDLLEAVGTLDELQAIVMIVGLEEMAVDIYEIMGEVGGGQKVLDYELKIKKLEERVLKIEEELKPLNKFLIFKDQKAVRINWARAVCRRAERNLVSLNKVGQVDPKVLIYINRLSDYLFMLSRKAEE